MLALIVLPSVSGCSSRNEPFGLLYTGIFSIAHYKQSLWRLEVFLSFLPAFLPSRPKKRCDWVVTSVCLVAKVDENVINSDCSVYRNLVQRIGP